MAIGTLQIDGQKFRVVPEAEYRMLEAAARLQQREAAQELRDIAVAERRIKDPKRKSIPLARLKAELGL